MASFAKGIEPRRKTLLLFPRASHKGYVFLGAAAGCAASWAAEVKANTHSQFAPTWNPLPVFIGPTITQLARVASLFDVRSLRCPGKIYQAVELTGSSCCRGHLE